MIKAEITGEGDCLHLRIDNPELDDKIAYAVTVDEIPEILGACQKYLDEHKKKK